MSRFTKYYEKNKDKILTKNKSWRQNNPDLIKTYNSRYKNTIIGRYARYKRSAREREVEFSISLGFFRLLIGEACVYCSTKPAMGVDRIDSSKGYVEENSTPCCRTCNQMKLDHTRDFFLSHVRKIVEVASERIKKP